MMRLSPRSTLFPYTTLFRSFVSASTSVGLAAPVPLTIEGTGVVAEFSLPRGNTATFFLRQADRGSEANLLIPEKTGENRSEEHTSELQSLRHLVCRLLLEKK